MWYFVEASVSNHMIRRRTVTEAGAIGRSCYRVTGMSEPERQQSGYGRNWLKYLLIYVVIGAVVYAAAYFLFFRDGGYFS